MPKRINKPIVNKTMRKVVFLFMAAPGFTATLI